MIWNYENCKSVALKYNNRTDFKNNNRSAYNYAYKNKFLNDICSHMILTNRKPRNYWTKEQCHHESLKYKTKSEFKNENKSAYKKALLNNWLDEICSHMKPLKKPNGYWTKERCQKEALKYKTKSEFYNNNNSAYSKALNNKWLDDICTHMKQINNSKRCIYACEFLDNHVYIGLTNNLKRRINKHEKSEKSQVYKHILKSKLSPNIIQLTNYLNINLAKEKEEYYLNYYKLNNWTILNVAKTGSLGSNIIKWNYENCKNEALKINSKYEFQLKRPGAYKSALKNNWLNDICSHMKPLKNYWTKEKCHQEALKYNKKIDFYNNNNSAYRKAKKENWLDDICSHMIQTKNPFKYWNYENCKTEALKFNSRISFLKSNHSAYESARKNNWLNDICSHMK